MMHLEKHARAYLDLQQICDDQAKRIAELEQALCESEARSLLNFQRFEAAMEGEQLTWARTHDWDACHPDEKKDRIAFARKWLKDEA